MPPLPYTRPLIKISGEALMGAGGMASTPRRFPPSQRISPALRASGARVAVVVGGGNIFRGITGASHGIDRVKADFMGMLATVMNGVALEQALRQEGQAAALYSGLPVPTVCKTFSRDEAAADLDRGAVVVLAGGTGNPFFTTDTTRRASRRRTRLRRGSQGHPGRRDLFRRSQDQSARRALRPPHIFRGAGPRPQGHGRRRDCALPATILYQSWCFPCTRRTLLEKLCVAKPFTALSETTEQHK